MAHRVRPTDVAQSIPFDNDTNGFTSENVQDAIEEVNQSATGNLLDFPFVASGNTANKWLGYVNSAAPSNQIPFVVPQDIDIKGLTFSNRDDNVDIDVEVYKNGSLVYTWEVRNKRIAWNVGIVGPSLTQGDTISVFLKRYTGGTGDSTAQDPIIEVYGKITDEASVDSGQQYGVT